MLRTGRIAPGRVVQSCGAGLLPLQVTEGLVTLCGGAPSWGDEVEPGPLLAAVGLTAADLSGPRVEPVAASTSTICSYAQRHSRRSGSDLRAVAAFGGAGVSVVSWDGRAARCRVFAAGAGVAEDPATGSAALALGVHLVVSGLVAADGDTSYDVVQGVEMGRASLLRCTVTAEAGRPLSTQVTGSTVPIARGEIRVPT